MAHEKERKSVLPNLPLKAKVKSDHLSFREPGNKAAKTRCQQLNDTISSLEKEEDGLKKEQAEKRTAFRKLIDDSGQNHTLPARSPQYQNDKLYKKIRVLLQATKTALYAVTDSGNMSETTRKQDAERLENIRKDRSTGKEELDMFKRRLKHLASKRGKMEEELQEQKKYEEKLKERPWEVIAEDPQELEEEENVGLADGRKEKDELEEGSNLNASDTGPDARGRMNGLELGGDIRDREESSSQARVRQKTKNDKDVKRKQETEKMIIQRLLNETREKKEDLVDSIEEVKEDISNYMEREKKMEKSLEEMESTERGLQTKGKQAIRGYEDEGDDFQATNDEENDSEKKLQEWLQQEEREQALYNAQADLQNMVYKSSMTRMSQSRKPRWVSAGLGDDKSEERGQLRLMEKILEDAIAFEAKITEFRHLRDKISRVRDFRVILKKEHALEQRWIDLARKQVSSSSGVDHASTGKGHLSAKDHLSGNHLEEHKIYKPLKPGEVRLVLLMPAPKGCEHYPLVCALDTRKWESKGAKAEYAALSYFWGTDDSYGRLFLLRMGQERRWDPDNWGTTTKRAICIPVRENLFRALLRLRRNDSPVALWIDYLSINQADTKEKTDQLGNMVDVYHKAKNVCVWLGESDRDGRSDDAMDFIPTIMDFAVLDRYAKDKQQAKRWYALAELMRDRWFSRRWVVQEISLARSATVHCGGMMVQWSDFADAVSLLASNQDSIQNLFDFSQWREGPSTLGDVESFGAHILLEATSKLFLRTASGGIRTPITNIEALVTSLKTFDTSDRRDLIYSIVSIASDTSRNSSIYTVQPAKERDFPVDYSRSEIQVFQDFTWFCIESSRSLDIICRPWAMPARDEKGALVDMPSWIPLLSDSEYGAPDEVYSGRENGENLVGPYGSPRYSASKKIPCKVELGQGRAADLKEKSPLVPVIDAPVNGDGGHGRSLLASGFKLAQIDKVAARNTGGVILQEPLRMGSWEGIGKSDDSVPDKIWRTLVADRDPKGDIPPSWYQRACLRCLEVADTFNNGDINVGELLQGHSEMLRKYLTRVRSITWNRSFFTATMRHPDGENGRTEPRGGPEENLDGGEPAEVMETVNGTGTRELSGPHGAKVSSDTAEESENGFLIPDEARSYNTEDELGSGDSEEAVENADADDQDLASEKLETPGSERDESLESGSEDGSDSASEKGETRSSVAEKDDYELFGLGPPRMKEGDFICILYGCSVPVVLRAREQGCYRLVGEVYVHGKMDGEGIEDFDENKTWGKEETFEIQ